MTNFNIPPVDYEQSPFYTETTHIDEIESSWPKALFKARYWGEPLHRDIINKREIYFPSVHQLSDPDDCKYPIIFNLSFPVIYDAYKDIITYKFREKGIRPNLENVTRKVQELYDQKFATEDQRKKWESDFWEDSNSRYHVFCASKYCDNPKFWIEHANNFKGFCVEFDNQKIHRAIKEEVSIGGYVEYVSRSHPPIEYHFPGGTNQHLWIYQMLRLIHTKYEDFDFENEYRLIKYDFKGHPKAPVFSKTFVVPSEGYSSIIFGEDIDPGHEQEICDACMAQNLNVVYKKAYRSLNGVEIRVI